MKLEEITVEGGPLDGTIAMIRYECSRLGFFIHQHDAYLWGYFDHGDKDKFGRRIFRPGKRKDAQCSTSPKP